MEANSFEVAAACNEIVNIYVEKENLSENGFFYAENEMAQFKFHAWTMFAFLTACPCHHGKS